MKQEEPARLPWPRKISLLSWVSLGLFSLLLLSMGSTSAEALSGFLQLRQPLVAVSIQQLPPVPILRSKLDQPLLAKHVATSGAVQATQVTDPPSLSAQAYYAFDLESQTQLAAKAENLPVAPASTTKLLTALVALDVYSLDEVITVSLSDGFENQVGFVDGEQIIVRQALGALLIASSNETAYALARNYPSGYEAFVEQMNLKAAELGMTQSHFSNPAGFDAPDHVTTAHDLSFLARAALRKPLLQSLVKQPYFVVTDVSGLQQHRLTNTNVLLQRDVSVEGVKTGTTLGAKEVLISQFVRDGHHIQLVVLGSEDRYADTLELLNWILTSYQWVSL